MIIDTLTLYQSGCTNTINTWCSCTVICYCMFPWKSYSHSVCNFDVFLKQNNDFSIFLHQQWKGSWKKIIFGAHPATSKTLLTFHIKSSIFYLIDYHARDSHALQHKFILILVLNTKISFVQLMRLQPMAIQWAVALRMNTPSFCGRYC